MHRRAPARPLADLGVMSATYACAAAMLPPIAPASVREANSVASAAAVPKRAPDSPA